MIAGAEKLIHTQWFWSILEENSPPETTGVLRKEKKRLKGCVKGLKTRRSVREAGTYLVKGGKFIVLRFFPPCQD